MKIKISDFSGPVDDIVRSYSSIKQYFMTDNTIRQHQYDQTLKEHLCNIEFELQKIRSNAEKMMSEIQNESSHPDQTEEPQESSNHDFSINTFDSSPKPRRKSNSKSKKSGFNDQQIDISKYRSDIFATENNAENVQENRPVKNWAFKLQLENYQKKCRELEDNKKALEERLWLSFSIVMISIFILIMMFHSTSKFAFVYFLAAVGIPTLYFYFFVRKKWQKQKVLRQEKADKKAVLETEMKRLSISAVDLGISNEELKYIDEIINNYNAELREIKIEFIVSFIFWLLFYNSLNFLILYVADNWEMRFICLSWALISAYLCAKRPLFAWLTLRNQKLALQCSKKMSSSDDPEFAMLSPDELGLRLESAFRKKIIFFIVWFICTICTFFPLSAILVLFKVKSDISHPGAITFMIVTGIILAMDVVFFLCFNKYRKEYNRLQRR